MSSGWSQTSSPDHYQEDSPTCVIRIPTSQIPKELPHPLPEPEVVDTKDGKSGEGDQLRMSNRDSSVLRPRAVLSSPDNDEMVGSRNRKRIVEPSPLRNNITVQNRHTQCKIVPPQTPNAIPISIRRLPQNVVKDHTPSATRRMVNRRTPMEAAKDIRPSTPEGSLFSTKSKQKEVAKDHIPSKVKRSAKVIPSQRVCLKTRNTNSTLTGES